MSDRRRHKDYHAAWALPTAEQAMAMGAEQLQAYLHQRNELIKLSQYNPLIHQYEPEWWWFVDGIMGWPWVEQERVEACLKMAKLDEPLEQLLLIGGNRSAKTQYGLRTALLLMYNLDPLPINNPEFWAFQKNNEMSVTTHQNRLYELLLPEHREKQRSKGVDVSWTPKYGFSASRVIVNGNVLTFKNYEQAVDSQEGGKVKFVLLDEHAPYDLVKTLALRIADSLGWLLWTFTPTRGYTPAVASWMDGATEVLNSIAYVCPKDGGGADVMRMCGFEDPEQYQQSHFLGPSSIPERWKRWVLSGGEEARQVLPSAGRAFETVPRFLKCKEDGRGVFFVHTADNPFGEPRSVYSKSLGNTIKFIRCRMYGVPERSVTARFGRFNPEVHVVPHESIPLAQGTMFLAIDPCDGRNWFMLWGLRTADTWYIYDEWPNHREIPGYGVLGDWVEPGQKHDGHPGPAQDTLGWSLLEYKREMARIEGWEDAKGDGGGHGGFQRAGTSENDPAIDWDPEAGSVYRVYERFLDKRYAASSRVSEVNVKDLFDQLEDIGLPCVPAPARHIESGLKEIESLLSYDPTRPVDVTNRPHLFFSERCKNAIHCMGMWTGQDGQKGAAKDPIDDLRMLVTSDAEHIDQNETPIINQRGHR